MTWSPITTTIPTPRLTNQTSLLSSRPPDGVTPPSPSTFPPSIPNSHSCTVTPSGTPPYTSLPAPELLLLSLSVPSPSTPTAASHSLYWCTRLPSRYFWMRLCGKSMANPLLIITAPTWLGWSPYLPQKSVAVSPFPAVAPLRARTVLNMLFYLTSGVQIRFPLWGGGIPTPGGYLLYNFTQLFGSKCACATGSVRMTHMTITLSIHIHFMVRQCFLGGDLRDASPKGYYQAHFLTGVNKHFYYYPAA